MQRDGEKEGNETQREREKERVRGLIKTKTVKERNMNE